MTASCSTWRPSFTISAPRSRSTAAPYRSKRRVVCRLGVHRRRGRADRASGPSRRRPRLLDVSGRNADQWPAALRQQVLREVPRGTGSAARRSRSPAPTSPVSARSSTLSSGPWRGTNAACNIRARVAFDIASGRVTCAGPPADGGEPRLGELTKSRTSPLHGSCRLQRLSSTLVMKSVYGRDSAGIPQEIR
jgi:hypothetical protein